MSVDEHISTDRQLDWHHKKAPIYSLAITEAFETCKSECSDIGSSPCSLDATRSKHHSDAAHEIHPVPKAHCERFFFYFSFSTPDFTQRAWLQLMYDWDAKKRHQNPKPPSPPPQPGAPPTPPSPPPLDQASRKGSGQVVYAMMKEPWDTSPKTKPEGRSGERDEW